MIKKIKEVDGTDDMVLTQFHTKKYKEYHKGHKEIIKQTKKHYPDKKICVKIWNPYYNWMHVFLKDISVMDELLESKPMDSSEAIKWFNDQGVDYYTENSLEECKKICKGITELRLSCLIPAELIKELDISALQKEAEIILKKEKLYHYKESYNCMTLSHIMAALSGCSPWKYRIDADKDGWYACVKWYIYKTYGDCEYLLIDTIRDKYGLPLSTSRRKLPLKDKKIFKFKKDKTHSYDWLDGVIEEMQWCASDNEIHTLSRICRSKK